MNLLNLDWSKILLKKKANRKNREGRSGRVTPSSDQGANRTAVPTPQWSPAYKGRKRTARPPGAVLFTSRHVAGRASRVTLAGQERYSPSFSRATVPGATRTATRNRPKNKKKFCFFFVFVSVFDFQLFIRIYLTISAFIGWSVVFRRVSTGTRVIYLARNGVFRRWWKVTMVQWWHWLNNWPAKNTNWNRKGGNRRRKEEKAEDEEEAEEEKEEEAEEEKNVWRIWLVRFVCWRIGSHHED